MHRWEDSTLPATTPNRPGSDSTSPLDRRILLRAFRDPGRPQPPRSAKRRDTVGNIPEPRACRRHLDETVFGLEGVTTFTVGGGRTGLNPGEALFIPRRVIHGFSNNGDVDARFLSIISPGLMGSRYFKDVADVLAGDGPVAREQREARGAPGQPVLRGDIPERWPSRPALPQAAIAMQRARMSGSSRTK